MTNDAFGPFDRAAAEQPPAPQAPSGALVVAVILRAVFFFVLGLALWTGLAYAALSWVADFNITLLDAFGLGIMVELVLTTIFRGITR